MEMYDLVPKYDSRASFYGKAKVVLNSDGSKVLYSYDTEVAKITPTGNLKVNGYYSATTARHINEFAKQNGFPTMTKAQMESGVLRGKKVKVYNVGQTRAIFRRH